MPRILYMVFSMIAFSIITTSPAWSKFAEATQDVRDVEVKAKLKAQPKAVLVYAKGLCCPSCAIGVRKMLSRLDFVDTSKGNSGIELDAKHQLVSITLKAGSKADLKALAAAVDDAGYEPVHAYEWQNNKVLTSNLGPTLFRVVP